MFCLLDHVPPPRLSRPLTHHFSVFGILYHYVRHTPSREPHHPPPCTHPTAEARRLYVKEKREWSGKMLPGTMTTPALRHYILLFHEPELQAALRRAGLIQMIDYLRKLRAGMLNVDIDPDTSYFTRKGDVFKLNIHFDRDDTGPD